MHREKPLLVGDVFTAADGEKRMAETNNDDCADSQFFEGVEKLLEIWFTSSKGLQQHQGDLRQIPR